MNSKDHLYTSLAKSLLRIICAVICIIILPVLLWPAVIFILAEVLGVVEELVDRR